MEHLIAIVTAGSRTHEARRLRRHGRSGGTSTERSFEVRQALRGAMDRGHPSLPTIKRSLLGDTASESYSTYTVCVKPIERNFSTSRHTASTCTSQITRHARHSLSLRCSSVERNCPLMHAEASRWHVAMRDDAAKLRNHRIAKSLHRDVEPCRNNARDDNDCGGGMRPRRCRHGRTHGTTPRSRPGRRACAVSA